MNWYQDILDKIKQDGPIRLYVSEEEYEPLRKYVANLWSHPQSLSSDGRLLLLAFFRAYTFYRELSEEERKFWHNFHVELDIQQESPSTSQYDELWQALQQNPHTRPLCHTSSGEQRDRREFVQTIDAIWGIRSLRAAQLIKLFLAYYRDYSLQTITSELIRRILPDAEDTVLHQASAYDQVFRSMVPVVNYLLASQFEVVGVAPEALIGHLQGIGLELGQPNCVRFFSKKSPHAIAEIMGTLKAEPWKLRPRWKPRGQLAESGPTAQPAEERKDVRYTITRLHNLNPLDLYWKLSSNRYLLEGQIQGGELSLPDGRFARFRWKPLLGESGEALRSSHHCEFDEDTWIEFELESQCLAVRFLNPQDQRPMAELSNLRPGATEVKLFNPYSRDWKLRYSLGSDPVKVLDGLEGLDAESEDRLLVEVCLDERQELWLPLARVPVRIPPILEQFSVERDTCFVRVSGPKTMRLTLTECDTVTGQQVEQRCQVRSGEAGRIKLIHPQKLRSVRVGARLEAGKKVAQAEVTSPPYWQLEDALKAGLAWGELVVGRSPVV